MRAKAKAENLPLVGFTVDTRHCNPSGIKTDLYAALLQEGEQNFLKWLKEWANYAYRGRLRDAKVRERKKGKSK